MFAQERNYGTVPARGTCSGIEAPCGPMQAVSAAVCDWMTLGHCSIALRRLMSDAGGRLRRRRYAYGVGVHTEALASHVDFSSTFAESKKVKAPVDSEQ